jgi:hypothetical protein
MAICRWSDDDYSCDLYIYEGEGGYVTHVASNRLGWLTPPRNPWSLPKGASDQEFRRALKKYDHAVDSAPRVPIGGPFDGQGFFDDEVEDLLARVLSLRSAGYRVPDWVIEHIEEEVTLSDEV